VGHFPGAAGQEGSLLNRQNLLCVVVRVESSEGLELTARTEGILRRIAPLELDLDLGLCYWTVAVKPVGAFTACVPLPLYW
jgi:hypothetical protein